MPADQPGAEAIRPQDPSRARSAPPVSVVIPTHNRAAEACACAESVLSGGYGGRMQVIIADDASADGTEAAVKARFGADARVIYTRSETNRLAAAARNMGAARADGDFILFLDCDNIAAPDMVRRLAEAMQSAPALGLAAPLCIQSRGAGERLWGLGFDYDFRTSRPKNIREGEPLSLGAPIPALTPTRYSPNAMMVARAAFEAAGGFDESYGMMYEEADFGFRVTGAGFGAAVVGAARTTHLGAEAAGAPRAAALRLLGIESPRRAYHFARNRTRFMRRHAPRRFLPAYHLFFAHVFAAYYALAALRRRRADIAMAYLRGHLRGLLGLD